MTVAIDLSFVPANGALVYFQCRNGEQSCTLCDRVGDLIHVRYEHGWHVGYLMDGTREDGHRERDMVVAEIVESFDQAVVKYGDGVQWGLRP